MELKQLVRINEEGLVADAVNFGMMEDATKNLSLCDGFVFNFDSGAPKSSTVGVLDCVRRSFFSRSEPNVHLVVQDYGKGKSHFALVMANYFNKTHDSPEIKGILRQIEVALGTRQGILDDLRGHKERTKPYLVIAISGERQVDLKQMLLKQIRHTLLADGVTDSIAQHLCQRPLEYMQSLNQAQRTEADNFLRQDVKRYGQIDTAALTKVLESDGYREIPTVKDISRHLNGFPIDFGADLSVEEILQDLLQKLCRGADRRYQGILILFDELNVYLQSWALNPAAAGGMTLQNITNICENNKGDIALACFTQIKPSHATALPPNSLEVRDYKKLTSRLELGPSTYEPMASLELVLDNLINAQQHDRLQEFMTIWRGGIQRDSERAFRWCAVYEQRRWPFSEFLQHLGIGSFPLHPLAAYLLCNLDFMQGRTAIQFVKENVKQFIATQSAEKDGLLNYLQPVELVDAFRSNLSGHPQYPDFNKAITAVQASATDGEIKILKALFLFYVSGGKVRKPDSEPHEEVLSSLCGMTPEQARISLQKLSELGVVYHIPATHTYRFYSGFGLNDLKRLIDDEVAQVPRSIEDVVSYVDEHLNSLFKLSYVDAEQFVAENRLVSDDWRFAIRALSPDQLRDLLGKDLLEDGKFKGTVAFLMPATAGEAQLLKVECEESIKASALRSKVVVAVPRVGLSEVSDLIVRVKTLKRKSPGERERYGAAHVELLKMWEQDIEKRLNGALRDVELCGFNTDRLPLSERKNLSCVVSLQLRDRFGVVPTVENIDKMRSGHTTGAKIVTFMVKQLLGKTLTKQSFPDKSFHSVIDALFLRSWGLLRLSGTQYQIQPPTNSKVRAAWDNICDSLPLEAGKETRVSLGQLWKTLSSDPYGYNDLTFTAVVGAWLVYHRAEIRISQTERPIGQPPRLQEFTVAQFLSNPDLDVPSKFIKVWQRDEVFVTRQEAIPDPNIPDTMSSDEGRKFVSQIQNYLDQDVQNQTRAAELRNINDSLVIQITRLDRWEQSCRQLMSELNSSELADILELHSKLKSPPDSAAKTHRVLLSDAQLTEQVESLDRLHGVIRDRVSACVSRASSIKSDQELRALTAQIERDLQLLRPLPSIHEEFSEALSGAVLTAERRMDSLRGQQKYQDCIANIDRVLKAVSRTTSQTGLKNARAAIEDLAAQFSDAKASHEYNSAVQQIEGYEVELTRTLRDWERRSAEAGNKRTAESLIAEINSTRNRFDFVAEAAQIEAMSQSLLSTVERWALIERAEKDLGNFLASTQRQCERVLRAKRFQEAFTLYQELTALECPSAQEGTPHEKAEEESKLLKQSAKAHTEGLADLVCSQVPGTTQECRRLREELTAMLSLLSDVPEFATTEVKAEAALESLEATAKQIELTVADQQKLGRIRQFKRSIPNTVQICEAAINEVKELRGNLNCPDTCANEIDEIESTLERQAQKLVDQLSDVAQALPTVNSYEKFKSFQRSYDQLAMVFVGSRREDDYRSLDSKIKSLQGVFELLNDAEAQCLAATTVRQLYAALERVNETAQAEDLPGWARERISQQRNILADKVAHAVAQLDEWDAGRDALSSVGEIDNRIKAISAKAPIYEGSDLAERVRTTSIELLALRECVRIDKAFEILKHEKDAADAMEQIAQWRLEHESLVGPSVIAFAAALERRIADRLAELNNRRLTEWKKQVVSLRERANLVQSQAESPSRTESAMALLKHVAEMSRSYGPDVADREITDLKSIETECREILNRDRESQILVLFEQLPKDLQIALCLRLAERSESLVSSNGIIAKQ
jgi:soluble cytochrome b562